MARSYLPACKVADGIGQAHAGDDFGLGLSVTLGPLTGRPLFDGTQNASVWVNCLFFRLFITRV